MLDDKRRPRFEECHPLSISPVMPASSTPASTPASPGLPAPATFRSPSPDHDKESDIEPPTRPQSTPFPQHDVISSCAQPSWRADDAEQYPLAILKKDTAHAAEKYPSSRMTFSDLPTEIHEFILDHLFGVRGSVVNSTTSSKGWSTALRHSRRRQLSDLAMISRDFRDMVQGRLFKHIKIQGTRPSIEEAILFFSRNTHLRKHPRHIEVWSPVWERRIGVSTPNYSALPGTPDRAIHTVPADGGLDISTSVNSAYQQSSRNATLCEIFQFVDMSFPEACVLTLEGGHCKKPPPVRHFPATVRPEDQNFPTLHSIRTLVLKSAWNLIRSEHNFQTIMSALPNLREWNASYAQPKSKAYLNIARVVPIIPINISHLNISLEANYSREPFSPRFWRKIYPDQTHICVEIAKALPQLESFTYSGRICHHFFQQVVRLCDMDGRGNSRLKSIDLAVKNCCRASSSSADATGVSEMAFITALENLVLAGIRSLDRLKAVKFLRIRFIDLESPMPLLNPFFQLLGDQCTGLWSDQIISTLASSRPRANFVQLSEDFCGIKYDKEGKLTLRSNFPRFPALSLKVANYEEFSAPLIT